VAALKIENKNLKEKINAQLSTKVGGFLLHTGTGLWHRVVELPHCQVCLLTVANLSQKDIKIIYKYLKCSRYHLFLFTLRSSIRETS